MFGETKPGNTELLYHGIQNETSDIRAHVCPVVRRVYVFSTEAALEAIASGQYKEVPAYQAGIETATATGYLVPPMSIRGCVALELRESVWDRLAFADTDSLTVKGQKATRLIKAMICKGMFPLPLAPEEVTGIEPQISGQDILIRPLEWLRPIIVQVKCDYRGGSKHLNGSGNLYLQTSECNPWRYH